MKIDKLSQIEAVASTDKKRATINHVALEGNNLIATDGVAMVVLKCERDDVDTDGLIPVAAIKDARKLAARNPNLEITANGSAKLINGATYDRPDEKFPDWRKVIPERKKGATVIGLDPEKLLNIAKALNNGQQRGRLPHLRLEINGLSPIRITRSFDDADAQEFGLLMPVVL